MLSQGVPMQTIARYYGVSVGTVQNHLKKFGIKSKRERLQDITEQELRELSVAEIVDKYSCTRSYVYKLKKKHGIVSHSYRKNNIDIVCSGEEVWRDISGFEGIYQVSNLGRVRSATRVINGVTYGGKIMSQFVTIAPSTGKPCGTRVRLRDRAKSNKQFSLSVGKLVLEAFVGEAPYKAKQVRHKNGNSLDNSLKNLEWDCSKVHSVPVNECARKLYEQEAVGIVRGICFSKYRINTPWRMNGYDTEDLMQECLLAIWEAIDLYDETHCTFYTFCRNKVQWVRNRLLRKAIGRAEIADIAYVEYIEDYGEKKYE